MHCQAGRIANFTHEFRQATDEAIERAALRISENRVDFRGDHFEGGWQRRRCLEREWLMVSHRTVDVADNKIVTAHKHRTAVFKDVTA